MSDKLDSLALAYKVAGRKAVAAIAERKKKQDELTEAESALNLAMAEYHKAREAFVKAADAPEITSIW